jgi:hypothetical protein
VHAARSLPADASLPHCPAVPELKRLIKSRLVGCAAEMLLMARGGSAEGEPEPPHPWFSGRLVVRAVNTLADMGVGGSGSDKQAQQRALLDKVRES